MRPILVILTLLAATAAFAQTDKTAEQIQTETRLTEQLQAQIRLQAALSCPVGIAARRQGSPVAIWTASLEDSHKSPVELAALHTGVHVDLNAPHKEIKQAELAVFFLPPGARTLPIAGSQFAPSHAPAPETHKNFSLAAGAASHRLAGDLLLGPVASVTHISLMRVIYSDGTEWTAHSSATCSREPSKFMLVDAK